MDLVNDNYQDFVSLGSTLADGEERIEEVRVGLLGFQRDINGVKEKVDTRRTEVAELLQQKRGLRMDIETGRVLLETEERLLDLEHRLGIARPVQLVDSHASKEDVENAQLDTLWDESDVEDSEDEFDDAIGIPRRLKNATERYRVLRLLQKKNLQHPFILSLRERTTQVYDTLRVDLETAVRQEDDIKIKQKIVQLRASIDE